MEVRNSKAAGEGEVTRGMGELVTDLVWKLCNMPSEICAER